MICHSLYLPVNDHNKRRHPLDRTDIHLNHLHPNNHPFNNNINTPLLRMSTNNPHNHTTNHLPHNISHLNHNINHLTHNTTPPSPSNRTVDPPHPANNPLATPPLVA